MAMSSILVMLDHLGRGQSVVVAGGTGEDDARAMRSCRAPPPSTPPPRAHDLINGRGLTARRGAAVTRSVLAWHVGRGLGRRRRASLIYVHCSVCDSLSAAGAA